MRSLLLLLLMAVGSGFVHAAPISYILHFESRLGDVPTLGFFTYDPSLESGSRFSVFRVIWKGFDVDLTDEANSPVIGKIGGECVDEVFSFMIQGAGCSTHFFSFYAIATKTGGKGFIALADYSNEMKDSISISDSVGVVGDSDSFVADFRGTWTVVEYVPEPSGAVLVFFGLVIIWRKLVG